MCKHKVHLYEIKSQRNYIYSCRNISSYVRILSKESTHDRALSVRGTLQTVDKVSHYCAGFFFAKYQNVQCLCGFFGTFLV